MSAATIQPRADGPIEHGLLVGTVAALIVLLAACGPPPRPSKPHVDVTPKATEVCRLRPLERVLAEEALRRDGSFVGCGGTPDPLVIAYHRAVSEADKVCELEDAAKTARLWELYQSGWWLGCFEGGRFEILPVSDKNND